MHPILVVCMLVACVWPVACVAVAKQLAGFNSSHNNHPRTFMAQLHNTAAARMYSCHSNSYEALPMFLSAILLCNYLVIPEALVLKLCLAFMAFRLLYTVAYAADWPTVRSSAWAMAFGCNVGLYILAWYFS